MTNELPPDRISFHTKFFFGLGASADNAINWIFNVLGFFYYQQILGLSGTLAGTAVATAIVADAVTDPLVGSISDRVRSKWGRRHPFIFFAPIPLAISIFLMFNPHESIVGSQMGMFLWFTLFTILLRTFQTIFAIPLLAMGAELSTDYIERSRIMSYESLFGLYGYVFMHLVAIIGIFGTLFVEEGGRLYQPAYTPVVMVCCVFVIITIFACAFGTKDQIPRLREREIELGSPSLKALFVDIWSVVKNRNYRSLLLGLLFLAITAGTHETLGVYMATFFWELDANQWGLLIIGNVIGTHISFFVAPSIHKKFDKRWSIFFGCLFFAVFWSLASTLKLLGVGPEPSTWLAVFWIGSISTFTVFFGVLLTISVFSALADIADEHLLNTGQRQEGIFYAARTFFSKATNAFGHVVAGVAIDHYIELPPQSVPGEVAEDVLFRLGIVDGPFAMFWGVLGAFVYLGYRIDRRRYAEIQANLSQRGL